MMGFDFEAGSHGRYRARRDRFHADGGPLPELRHLAWWLLHNCVAHPAIGIAPSSRTFAFHDWTSRKLNRL
jgi:hypothetical protein